MTKDYYQFDPDDARRFASALNFRTREEGNQLVFPICPYCRGGKKPDKKTFSISLETGQFECKRSSCGAKGNMITLAKDFANQFDLGKDISYYYGIQEPKYKRFKDAQKKIEVKDAAIEFLGKRHIPEDIVRKYEITTMEHPEGLCVVFPFKDEFGNLVFYKIRKADGTEFAGGGKERSATGDCKKILFGMNQCEDFTTLVITEGQIDSLSLAAAGIKNAVSVPTGKKGFTWVAPCWNWLVQFEEIVVFGDNENGEITLSKEIAQRFPKKVRIVQSADYLGYKDANDILISVGADQLKKAVENAKVMPDARIRNLAEVETVNLEDMPHFPTGFYAIDNVIGGGFHKGEVNILTGKCGEGKSTFASQIVAKMIKNGLKCFCYSGELPDYMFKAWLDKQITNGQSAFIDKAQKFYDGKCFIYDNSSVVSENDEIFGLMESAVKCYGVNFILIDNLMTAMEQKAGYDVFQEQSLFVTRLTKFAKGFDVIILLIAHPKKGDSDDNDAISGSGDITNRANLVLRYQRKSKKPEDENHSLIKITKNRTTGKLNWEGIEVEYEPQSMRIHEIGNGVESFLNGEEVFEQIDDEDLDTIPF